MSSARVVFNPATVTSEISQLQQVVGVNGNSGLQHDLSDVSVLVSGNIESIKELEKQIDNLITEKEIIVDKGVTKTESPSTVLKYDGTSLNTGAKPNRGTINLGLILDFAGPFSAVGPDLELGIKLFWQDVNSKNGIGNKFNVIINQDNTKNNSYDVSTHEESYNEIKDNVLAFACTLGTSQTNSVYQDMSQNNLVTNSMSWTSEFDLPEYKNVLTFGSSYYVEGANILDYLAQNKLKDNYGINPVKVTTIYFLGDYGGDYADGIDFICQKYGYEHSKLGYNAPDFFNPTTIPEIIQNISTNPPDVLCFAVGPQLIYNPAMNNGLLPQIKNALGEETYNNLYICLASPSYNYGLKFTNTSFSYLGNDKVYVTEPFSNFNYNSEGSQNLISLLTENDESSRSNFILSGYVSQYNLYNILEKCVAENNLTRENIVKNINNVKYTYDGIITPKLHKGLKLDTFIVNVIENKVNNYNNETPSPTPLLKEENVGFYMSDSLVARGTTPPSST